MNTFVEIENLIKTLREDYNKPGNNDQFNEALRNAIDDLRNLKKFY